MIKINLLPSEERKKRAPVSKTTILTVLGAVVLVLGMAYGWYWLDGVVEGIKADIKTAETELKKFQKQAETVKKFEGDKKRLEEKIKIIGTLVAAQGGPVRLLDEISKALPNEVWLTSINRTGKKIDVAGIAFSNFSIASFMTNLGGASGLVSNVDLVVSEKATVEQRPVERFTITMELKEGKS
jgi:type IV pilus assembly protein PilN